MSMFACPATTVLEIDVDTGAPFYGYRPRSVATVTLACERLEGHAGPHEAEFAPSARYRWHVGDHP